VLATGCFTRCAIQRELEPAGARISFILEYRARTRAELDRYQREFAPALQRAHGERYAGRFDAARAIRRLETDAFPPGPA
jgi:Domain of unknown function (DUF4286)